MQKNLELPKTFIFSFVIFFLTALGSPSKAQSPPGIPEDAVKKVQYAEEIRKQGRLDEAIKILSEFIASWPDHWPSRYSRGLAYQSK